MDKPLVSVVIPAFQAEAFLGEAIESALAQTYAPLEVVVADDGSTDGTAEVAASYPEIRLLRLTHRGQAAARNSGVAASEGEMVAFHDADDVMLRDRLEIQMDHLLANPGVQLVVGGQELIFEDGATIPFWLGGREGSFRGAEEAGTSPAGGVHTMTLLARRKAFVLLGGFDESMSHAEDVDWLLRAREAGLGVSVLDRPLIRRRVHPGGLTQDDAAERRALVDVFRARIQRKRQES